MAQKVRYRSVFISDVHLGTRNCQDEALLLFLKSVDAEFLYLVGDIIDLWVVHGDDFDLVTKYHRWIALLGDRSYEFLLWLNRLFNRLRAGLRLGYWSLSAAVKHKVKGAVNFISDYEDSLAREARRRGFDAVVCGHIHHAEMRRFGDILYLNCGDWVESCSAVVEHCDGSFEVVRWSELQRTRLAACPGNAPFGALPPDDRDEEDVLEAAPGLSRVC